MNCQERKAICETCSNYDKDHQYCIQLDNNHSAHLNCNFSRHARWVSRITNPNKMCFKWEKNETLPQIAPSFDPIVVRVGRNSVELRRSRQQAVQKRR